MPRRAAMSSAARLRAGAPVAVTGIGVVSPIGNDLDSFDEALFAGRSAVRAHALDLPGIDVPAVPVAAADFDAAGVIAPSRVPLDRGTAMALAAADAAAGRCRPRRRQLRCRAARHLLGQRHGRRRHLRDDLPHRLRRAPPHAADERGHGDAERAGRRDRVALRRARRRHRLCLRMRVVGGGDRRGDAGDPRRLDRCRHRRRQRVAADAGRARELAGDARAGAARDRRRSRGERAASVPAVRGRPRRLRPRRGRRRLHPRIDRPGARARRGASLRPRRLCDELRRRPHHPARCRRASAGDASGSRRRGPVGRRDRLSQRPRHGDDGRRRRRGRIDRQRLRRERRAGELDQGDPRPPARRRRRGRAARGGARARRRAPAADRRTSSARIRRSRSIWSPATRARAPASMR